MAIDEQREHLYTQRVYPSVNNDDLLEFRIPPNTRGQLDLGNALLHFVVSIPKPTDKSNVSYPQNYLGPKQFSSVEVRVNGEAVTRRSCANEYFLSTYFQQMVNFSLDYQASAGRPIGIFDAASLTTTEVSGYSAAVKAGLIDSRTNIVTNSKEYEILMPIDSTIFYSNDLLPSNTSIDLSFERLSAKFGTILFADKAVTDVVSELKDTYLILPFKKDQRLFGQERNAISRPIKIQYDDYVIKRFNVPKGTNSAMMANLISGPLPTKMFWALQTMDAYGGSFTESSTLFSRNGVKKANLFLDGNEVNDYPVTASDTHVSLPFTKFLENTNQQLNGLMSRTLSPREFEKNHFILSATFDPTESGSLSFIFDFDSVNNKDLVLIVCSVFDRTMKIDQNRNFQII